MKRVGRGRSSLPRGYTLAKTAKHGGFEIGDENTLPILSVPGDYVTMGQAEAPVNRLTAGDVFKVLAIGAGIMGLFFGAKKIGLLGE